MELDRENDPERRKQILRDILGLKQQQLELVQIENQQKECEARNLRDAVELHHQMCNK